MAGPRCAKPGLDHQRIAMPKNSNKPWTHGEEDTRLLELNAAGKSFVMIGAELGRSGGAITGRLSILNTKIARLKRERAVARLAEA
jgi:hypothetical protein